MANLNKNFIVSVCPVYARDPKTLAGIWAGVANISTAFTLAMSETAVRGGEGNAMLMRYMHDRVLTIKITGATFSKEVLAMNVGADLTSPAANTKVLTEECADFAAGKATMTGTAVDKVMVVFENGSCETVTPATKALTLTVNATYTGKATLVYDSMIANVTNITIDTKKAPKVVDLVMVTKVKDADGAIVEIMNIHVPKFSVDGNYELSFSADGVSQEELSGTALATNGATCAEGDGYAYVSFIPVPVV